MCQPLHRMDMDGAVLKVIMATPELVCTLQHNPFVTN
jgi:hypothetical protein